MEHGISEDALGLLDYSTYNAMIINFGQPYKSVKKYTIMYWSYREGVVGQYSSKEQAKEKLGIEEASDEPISEEEEESNKKVAIKNDIESRISFFNSYYGYNFKPTDEQMEEMIELYNTSNENWGNDVLLEFLKQKGYVNEKDNSQEKDKNTTKTNKDTNQKNNETSSNSNQDNNKSSEKNENDSSTQKRTTTESSNSDNSQKQKAKENKKLSATVRVKINNTDSSKKYEYIGKNIKVMLNNEVVEDNYFNGDNYTATFLNVSTAKATIKVYIDGNLVKTQEANIESLAKQGNYYTDVDVNI